MQFEGNKDDGEGMLACCMHGYGVQIDLQIYQYVGTAARLCRAFARQAQQPLLLGHEIKQLCKVSNGPERLLRPNQDQLFLCSGDSNIQPSPVPQKVASCLLIIAAHQRQQHNVLVSALTLVNCKNFKT